MAFTLSTAVQNADDCLARGMDPDSFLPRFTFFFDISISFFEEIAKFRAGRRIWAQIARERFGAKDPRAWRFKFHAQTSGVDLTRQQPLNNVARVAVQAMAGIFGGLQSLHTDSYDEALSTPTDAGAQLPNVTCPVLIIEGGLDPDWADPRAEGEKIVADLPAGLGELAVIEGAGHYPHAQTPDQVLALTLPFLAKILTNA